MLGKVHQRRQSRKKRLCNYDPFQLFILLSTAIKNLASESRRRALPKSMDLIHVGSAFQLSSRQE